MNRRIPLYSLVRICVLLLSSASCATAGGPPAEAPDRFFDFVIPWDDAAATAVSLRGLSAAPAGGQGFVSATPEGHLRVSSGRIRFWGVNLAFGANFPDKDAAPAIAARIAKYGVNLVRFHHMDNRAAPDGLWKTINPDRELDPEQLDKLDFFIAELKKNGVYADLNLLVSRPFRRGSDLPADIEKVTDWKRRATLGFFDDQLLSLQKTLARDLLTHRNPYTGRRYTDEPAVAFIEINNENGLAHSFLSGELDDLPAFYAAELRARWNAWLAGRYRDQAALERAWRARLVEPGREALANGDFSSGPSGGWNMENHGTARSTAAVDGDGPAGRPALRLSVTSPSSAGWHVQFNQPRLTLAADAPYTLEFDARSDAPGTLDVNIGMAHDPWENLGFQATVSLDRAWKHFTFPSVMLARGDDNARLNFSGLGLTARTVWIAGVSLRPGGAVGLRPGERLGEPGIGLFTSRGGDGRTREGRRDWFTFLLETEERYWNTMHDFIKRDLKARPLVFGTIVGTSTPGLQAEFDAVDSHAYWNHPTFPHRAWDPDDWFVLNTAMVNHPRSSTLAGLFVKRVKGKPHCLTEYNHAFPNVYEAEAFPLVALYAGLQDWDVVIPFAYSHRLRDWDTRHPVNFFDVDQNPLKLASFVPAALAFRRGDVRPAVRELSAALDRKKEEELLPDAHAWRLVDGGSAGLDPVQGFIHRLSIDPRAAMNTAAVAADVERPVFTSDTGQLVWDASLPGRGLVTADTPRTKMAVGFSGGRTVDLGGVVIETKQTVLAGFAVIGVTVTEGDSFANARRLVVTALGAQENTGSVWYRYPRTRIDFPPAAGEQVTFGNNYGRAPSRVEGIEAVLTLPYPARRLKVWALDAAGHRSTAVKVVEGKDGALLRIGPQYQAVWYEVEVGD